MSSTYSRKSLNTSYLVLSSPDASDLFVKLWISPVNSPKHLQLQVSHDGESRHRSADGKSRSLGSPCRD